jgi:glycosyltransferase involved in cell wall biosynthesis
LRRYIPHVTYLHQSNQGVSAARNHGIREARGEFIAFLDSDDVWHPRKLEFQLRVFKDQVDLGILGTAVVDWPGQSFREIANEAAGRVLRVTWPELVVKNRLITSSVIVREVTLRAAKEFDTQLHSAEDRDLWLRIAEIAPVANLDLPLTGYRMQPGSLSKQPEISETGMLRILDKLDQRRVWKGRLLLRRKAYGYLYHSCSWIYLENSSYGRAVLNLLKSFIWYPLPFRRAEVRTRFERSKRLIVAMTRMLRSASLRQGRPVAPASQAHSAGADSRFSVPSASRTGSEP